jgi:hypothetical protein
MAVKRNNSNLPKNILGLGRRCPPINTVAMEKLNVPQINSLKREHNLREISTQLDRLVRHPIEEMPWPRFSYKPRVSFAIAHCGDAILLKYFVQEHAIRIVHHTVNSPVHEDSCVEFFISFGEEETYYNLEFNCIGTCLFGFGKSRSDRQLITEEAVNKIRRMAVIESSVEGGENLVNWHLTLVMPMEIFVHHRIGFLKERNCRVNFYKCGDGLPEPHFLSWKVVKAAAPDFHLPKYFGAVHFM